MAEKKKKITLSACPTKYRPEMCNTLLQMMADGAVIGQVCAVIKISHETFNKWAHKNEDFCRAYKIGRVLAETHWIKIGLDNLNARYFNSRIWERTMRTQFKAKWSDNFIALDPDAIKGYANASIKGRIDILNKALETERIQCRQHKALMDTLRVEAEIIGNTIVLPHIQKGEAERELKESKITKAEYNQRLAIIRDLEKQVAE